MDDVLSTRQTALLIALREFERSGDPVDVESLARQTGYSKSSIRTYFTKRLEGVLVFRGDGGVWRARGALRCTEEEFARRMSQKSGAANLALRTEGTWREVVRKLLYEGQRRHYTLSREEMDLVADLAPDPTPRLRTDEVDVQTKLF